MLLGTQGWSYPSWVGPFYPAGTRQTGMLEVYGRAFHTVEVDATFYAVPGEAVLHGWREQVPEGFLFALKVPQAITHERRLVGAEPLLRRFLDRAAVLGSALGPLLVQLSPDFHATQANREALAEFVSVLPIRYRWAVEFRHADWLTAGTLELLGRYNVALVLADARWVKRGLMLDLAIEPTTNFSYVRWIGAQRRVVDYSRVQVDRDDELALWARALETIAPRVSTIFGYVHNQYQGHGPHTARALQRILGQEPTGPELLREQAELF